LQAMICNDMQMFVALMSASLAVAVYDIDGWTQCAPDMGTVSGVFDRYQACASGILELECRPTTFAELRDSLGRCAHVFLNGTFVITEPLSVNHSNFHLHLSSHTILKSALYPNDQGFSTLLTLWGANCVYENISISGSGSSSVIDGDGPRFWDNASITYTQQIHNKAVTLWRARHVCIENIVLLDSPSFFSHNERRSCAGSQSAG